jgi:D-alanine--poly(phosphoribitol) ligase subunit 1
MNTPLDQLADCLYTFGDEPAFCIDHHFHSYSDLKMMIGGIQATISTARVTAHSNIGIVTYNDLETYAAIFAVLYSGHAFVPINPAFPAARNESILEEAGIRIILSSRKDQRFGLSEKSLQKVITTSLIEGAEFIQAPLSHDQPAYILFTSGSTGLPKGVPVTVQNLNSFIEAFFAFPYQLDHRDKFVQMFDLTFDLSIMSYIIPLCIGACVYTVPFDSIKYTYIYSLLEKYEITFALLVPSVLTNLRKYFPEINLPQMKYSLFCGEALYEDIALEWAACLPNAMIRNTYGPTEATIFCMIYQVNKEGNNKSSNGILSIGRPMQNTEAMIFSNDLVPLPPGEKGELCLTGLQLSPGYLTESQNKSAFFQYKGSRYYRTGDECFMDDSGDYFFTGRLDGQVKINGYRVEAGEIEFHARAFLKTNVVVIPASSEEGTKLYLFAQGNGHDFTLLTGYLKSKLPAYMIPAGYFQVAQMPLNVNGKVDRNALMNMIG